MITRYVWGLVVLSAALGGFRCDALLSAPVMLRAVPAANPITAAGEVTLVAAVQDTAVMDEWWCQALDCTVRISTRSRPPGASIDLGDLEVPADRVPVWEPGVEGGIPDTSAWPTINALDYGAVPNDGGDDAPGINAAINVAADQGGFRVVYLPPGTYRFARGSSMVLRSNIVLRGAGVDQTTVTGDQGRVVANEWGGVHVVGSAGSEIQVVGGTLGRGSDTLELGSVDGVSVDDWMFLRQDNDRSSAKTISRNRYLGALSV